MTGCHNSVKMMEEIGRQLIECGHFWRDPIWQRSTHVRDLRRAVGRWAYNSTKLKKTDVELSAAIQACARLEHNLAPLCDPELFEATQDQVASLRVAADAILANEEMLYHMAERSLAALDSSHALFGKRGVIKQPPQCPPRRLTDCNQAAGRPVQKGWQPRWHGDCGDPFDPYMVIRSQQLVEQFVHSAIQYHARSLQQLSSAYAALRRANKTARDVQYVRTLSAAAGVTVKEYYRLQEMFHKIDHERHGSISMQQLMAAMKRDKDIAAFMQLSRGKDRHGHRESFQGVFNRIDTEGVGTVTWESFLRFFSCERSLATTGVLPPMVCSRPAVCPAQQVVCRAAQLPPSFYPPPYRPEHVSAIHPPMSPLNTRHFRD